MGASLHRQRYSTDGDLDLAFIGFDVAARMKGWELRGEWVDSQVDLEGDIQLEESGFYLQLGYTFSWMRDVLPQLSVVSRFDDVDFDQSVSGIDDRQLLSLGLNARIYDHLRLKAEYRWSDEQGDELDDDAIYLQAVLDF